MFKLIAILSAKGFDKPYVLEDDFGTQRALTKEKFDELVGKDKVINRKGEIIQSDKI